jgi:Uma2 family endonuclease
MSATAMTEQSTWPARTSPAGSAPGVSGDQRIVFRGVDWHTYSQLSGSLGEHQRVHLVYDGKDLEIMVIGNAHEILKDLISKIVTAVAMGLDVDCLGSGQATWKTEIRGLEADLSYYFNAEKIRTATAAWARRSMDPADYPRPDLAIEIDLSPSKVDRRAIYKEIAVTELWRFVSADKLIFEQLQPDGSYAGVEVSQFLRIRPDEVLMWVNEAATERQAVWNRRLNQWAMGLSRQAQEPEHA